MKSLFALTGQTSPLFKLPRELLIEIASHLHRGDHSRLSRSCPYLTATLQQDLFRRGSRSESYEATMPGNHEAWMPVFHEAIAWACRDVYRASQPNIHPIERALGYGCPSDVDEEVIPDHTALSLACCRYGNLPAVDYLLQRGASVDKRGKSCSFTPLGHALNCLTRPSPSVHGLPRFVYIILRLLGAGANPTCEISPFPHWTQPDFDFENAVTVVVDAAETNGLPDDLACNLIKELVRRGASPDGLSSTFFTPLGWAVSLCEESTALFDFLIDGRADPNYAATLGVSFTALGQAILYNNSEVTARLIHSGAYIGLPATSREPSPLWYATKEGSLGPLKVLLQNGANPNTVWTGIGRGSRQRIKLLSPLSMAVVNMHSSEEVYEQCVRYLLDYGAEPNQLDGLGRTSLYWALKFSSARCARTLGYLLGSNADPNQRWPDSPDPGDNIALVVAILAQPPSENDGLFREVDIDTDFQPTSKERAEVVKLLLQAGADANMCASWSTDETISPLQALLMSPLPTNDNKDDVAVNDATADYHSVEALFNTKIANEKVPADEGVTLTDFPDDLEWRDEAVPMLLKAGAIVTRRDLDSVKETLMPTFLTHLMAQDDLFDY